MRPSGSGVHTCEINMNKAQAINAVSTLPQSFQKDSNAA